MPALPPEPQASAQFSPPETEQTAAPEPKKIEIPSIPEEAGPAALREAAAKGDIRALFEIGNRYMEGRGVAENVKEAAKWYQLAANAGDKDAAEKRDQIAKALKPEMLTRAKGAVELWKAKPLDDAANSIDVPDAWTEAKPLSTSSVDMKKAVRNIQLILQKNGYDTGTADGMMGAKTRTAISAFQKANGQEPTGEVNQKLVQLLLEKNK